MNGNGNGVSWKWVAVAACALVMALGGAFVSGLQARVGELETKTAAIAVMQRDITYLRESSDRQEAKLDSLLARRRESAPSLTLPRPIRPETP